MAKSWEINERQAGSVTILELEGRFVFDASGALEEKLQSLIDEGRLNLLLYCNRVNAIDSQGIGSLVRGLSSVVKRGGSLKLLRPSERVAQGLALVGLQKVFEIFEDEAHALASFG